MPRLIALAVTPGPAYVAAIESIWERGDAFAPLDPRLPRSAQKRLLAALRPAAILDDSGEIRSLSTEDLDGEEPLPVAVGDALVLATSGTSGEPKGVVHTHVSVEASANATTNALDIHPGSDKWLACLPLSHIGGLSVVLRSLVTGTPVEVHDGFDAEAVMAAARRDVTLVSLVTRALRQVEPGRFRRILLGGAAPPDDLPPNSVVTYGMTETGSGVVYGIGPGQRLLDGLQLKLDDEGQIWLKGPMLFSGYRQGPSPFDDQGWFPTGDVGRWGAHGELVVEGRSGDVIVTGGEKVWPDPVERLLATVAGVAEVAVIGLPDEEWGHRVVAVVVPEAGVQETLGASTPTLEQLRDVVRAEIAPWAAPKQLVLAESLPRTSLGKVQRRALREAISEGGAG